MTSPMPPYLVLRLLNGGPILMPDYIQSGHGMEQYAAMLAAELRVDVGLVLPEGTIVWFAPDGSSREIVEDGK